jgi:hypothetical protein
MVSSTCELGHTDRVQIVWQYILFEWNDSDEELAEARRRAAEIGVPSSGCSPIPGLKALHRGHKAAARHRRSCGRPTGVGIQKVVRRCEWSSCGLCRNRAGRYGPPEPGSRVDGPVGGRLLVDYREPQPFSMACDGGRRDSIGLAPAHRWSSVSCNGMPPQFYLGGKDTVLWILLPDTQAYELL